MKELIYEPWPWYVAGPLIAVVMLSLMLFGKSFGFSANFRTVCSAFGAGKSVAFFDFDWRSQKWNLLFLLGAVIGGFIVAQITPVDSVELAPRTEERLQDLGVGPAVDTYLPEKLFGPEALTTPGGIAILIIGGFLVGFGARYAGGCTSGHAISGLSNLQWPSLIAVIGFFIGGLTMVHLIFPFIL